MVHLHVPHEAHVDSVVDVRIYAWDHGSERWILLTLGEQKALWEFRGRREPA